MMHRWWKKSGPTATIEELARALDVVRIPYIEEEFFNQGSRRSGRSITAFVSVQTTPETNPPFIAFIKASPFVLEGHFITGQASFILKIAVASIRQLEHFIHQASHYGRTLTSIVMSTHVQDKIICNDSLMDKM